MAKAKTKEEPIIKAISVFKDETGWVLLELEIQGDKVIKTTKSQDNLRSTIIDQFKIKSFNTFMIGD